jgi:hypothetical protein
LEKTRKGKKISDIGDDLRNAKQEIFEGRFGLVDLGSERLADFISKTFLPWSKANKRSWRHDVFRARTICDYFGTKTFREMPLLIEKFKRDRQDLSRGGKRSAALHQSITSLRC